MQVPLFLCEDEPNIPQALKFLPHKNTPEPAPAPAPAPAAQLPVRTRKEIAEIEVLRAEWRMYPSMRPAIEEAMARFGVALDAT